MYLSAVPGAPRAPGATPCAIVRPVSDSDAPATNPTKPRAPTTDADPPRAPARLPPSVTHFGLSCVSLCVVLAVMYLLRVKAFPFPVPNPVMALCAAVAVPVVLLDVLVLKVHLRETTGLDWEKPFEPAYARLATKLLGLVATLAPFALAYWVFPEYNGTFYKPFYELLYHSWPGLVLATIVYFMVVDSHMREPEDAYYRLGRVVLFRNDGPEKSGKKGEIANLYRGWLVKAYFFPLMFVWLNNSTHNVVNYDLSNASWDNLRAYDFLYQFIFFVDLVFSTVGYALCFRPIDTHIRTAEPTMLGWVVALFCYEPFFSGLMEKQYAHYGGNNFDGWLDPSQYPKVFEGRWLGWLGGMIGPTRWHDAVLTFRWVWVGVVVALILVYVLATITFGVRFSNLTHRGILTNGPFRYTKHPAYVSKNLSWWMTAVPFVITDDLAHTVKRCLLLGVVNFMYFMRAKTEERHLSRDPVYVEYALWMNEHGWLRFLGRIPIAGAIFRYQPPAQAVPITGEPYRYEIRAAE